MMPIIILLQYVRSGREAVSRSCWLHGLFQKQLHNLICQCCGVDGQIVQDLNWVGWVNGRSVPFEY